MNKKRLRVNRALSIIPDKSGGLTAVITNTGSALKINTQIFAVLEVFSSANTVENALNLLMGRYKCSTDELEHVIKTLEDKKVIVTSDEMEMDFHDRNYFGAYQQLRYQREMLMDTARTIAFEKAINEIVSSDDTVIDAGSGSGILAMMAARAGARKVYAIERSRVINIARAIAEKNGYSERVDFVQCMAEDFRCDEKATVLISELLGDFVLRELSFKSTCSVRDRCGAPNLKCIPSRVRMYMAPVEDAHLWLHEGLGYWKSPVYGFDFLPAFDVEYNRLGSVRTAVPETSLLDDRVLVHDIDYVKTPVDEFYFDSQVEFTARRDGALHGFAGSFDMQLSPTIWLDTGSHSKETHWQQVFFPLKDALPIHNNDRIAVNIKVQDPENPQKRNPDSYLDVKVWRGNKQIHHFSGWYDKARYGVF